MDDQAGEIPDLPPDLPTEEKSAAKGGRSGSLAERENEWLDQALTGHTVAAAGLRNDLARAYLENMKADREMRKTYAGRILGYLEWYSACVGALVLISMLAKRANVFVSDDVLKILVGSTAVSAIGLVGFIARGLFQAPPHQFIDPFSLKMKGLKDRAKRRQQPRKARQLNQ